MEKYGDELTILPSLTDEPQRRHVASFWKVGANLIIRNQGEGWRGEGLVLLYLLISLLLSSFSLPFLICSTTKRGGGQLPCTPFLYM